MSDPPTDSSASSSFTTLPSIEELYHTSFPIWYREYSHLTFRSIVLPIPPVIVQELLADGIQCLEESQSSQAPFFTTVARALMKLGGSCFIKTNWSAPRDAQWMIGTSLKCHSMSDIWILLQSSEFITRDLELCQGRCDPSFCAPTLVLRDHWSSLDTSMEFRCFISQHELLGICQRHCVQHFPFLADGEGEYEQKISDWLEDHDFVHREEDRENQIISATPDVVLDLIWMKQSQEWKLIDLNVFHSDTDALMFSWTELREAASVRQYLGLRIVQSEAQAQEYYNVVGNMSSYRVPVDFHASHLGLTTESGFTDFMSLASLTSSLQNESDSDCGEPEEEEES